MTEKITSYSELEKLADRVEGNIEEMNDPFIMVERYNSTGDIRIDVTRCDCGGLLSFTDINEINDAVKPILRKYSSNTYLLITARVIEGMAIPVVRITFNC